MEYKSAKEIAFFILKQLEPFCKQIDIAGSVRREKAEVKDIEIMCLARTNDITNLFGDILSTQKLPAFTSKVHSLGKIVKGDTNGRYMQIQLTEGIALDLFMPAEHDYFRQFAIRTGSSTYSQKVLATQWNKLGWAGTHDGLRRQDECKKDIVSGKTKWTCITKNPTLPPVWENEYEFFKFLELTWIEPSKRNA